jgi:hypothetical protein
MQSVHDNRVSRAKMANMANAAKTNAPRLDAS